jgi:hypothetical protein
MMDFTTPSSASEGEPICLSSSKATLHNDFEERPAKVALVALMALMTLYPLAA